MKEKGNPNKDSHFAKTLREVSRSLASGMTAEDFEAKQNFPISSEWTVRDLVEANLKAGYIRWREGKFITTNSSVSAPVSHKEYESLRKKAEELGMTVSELAADYINKGLSEEKGGNR